VCVCVCVCVCCHNLNHCVLFFTKQGFLVPTVTIPRQLDFRTSTCRTDRIRRKNTSLHYNSQWNEQSKRSVFRRLQQTGRDGADMTWHSRSFHVRAVAIGKTRSPTVDSRVRQTGSDDVDADLIPRSSGWKSSPTRYVSAVPLQRLKVRTASLYRIHSRISGRASVDDERAW